MSRFLSFIICPAGLLYLFLLVTQFIEGLYLARGFEPPGLYRVLYPLAFLWLIGWFLQKDSSKHVFKGVCDLGFFLYLTWPLSLPYYLFRTRGIKALLMVLGFLAVYLGTYIIGVMICIIFSL